MKAVLSKEVGGPDSLVIEDAPMPECGKGQVLIEVKACGVNFPDSLIIQDMYQFKPPRPFSTLPAWRGEVPERPVITSLHLLAVLNVLSEYASARQAARASY